MVGACCQQISPAQHSHVHHTSIAGSMTAPITTTSFGSSKLSSQSLESNHRSPLKRTHSDRQAPEDRRVEDGQRGRPIKKIKQGETAEGQEPDGLVARLFKYAWQFIGAPPEGKIVLLRRKMTLILLHRFSNKRQSRCKSYRRGQTPDITQNDG